MLENLGREFYFARHGETAYNARGVVTGACDIPLNEKGIVQAKEAASLVKYLHIASCITSPLERAIQTAQYMLENTVTITPIPALYERHWGKLEGTPKENLDKYSFSDYEVETWEGFVERTILALAEIRLTAPVLIVAHSGTFRALNDYLCIKAVKKPVRNAWPYKFYLNDSGWQVTIV